MMRLIIDGYNLIGAVMGHLHDIESERDELIDSLAAYKKTRNVKITVVFDGTHSKRLARGRENLKGIEVVFSRDGEEADRIIKDLAHAKGPGVTVVTSDCELASYARSRSAVVISSGEFSGLLDAALYEEIKGCGEEDETGRKKRGPSKRPSRAERNKLKRLKKL